MVLCSCSYRTRVYPEHLTDVSFHEDFSLFFFLGFFLIYFQLTIVYPLCCPQEGRQLHRGDCGDCQVQKG